MGAFGDAWRSNFSDGYQFGDFFSSLIGQDRHAPDLNSAVVSLNRKNYDTDQPMSFEQFYGDGNPYSLGNKINNFFTGKVSSAQDAYQNYLSEFEFRRNQEASAKANQETWAREDSQIQRLMEDYQKAGLNPYLLFNGGNVSGGVVSSQAQKPSYKKKALEEGKIESKMMNTAIKVLALLLLKKAIK